MGIAAQGALDRIAGWLGERGNVYGAMFERVHTARKLASNWSKSGLCCDRQLSVVFVDMMCSCRKCSSCDAIMQSPSTLISKRSNVPHDFVEAETGVPSTAILGAPTALDPPLAAPAAAPPMPPCAPLVDLPGAVAVPITRHGPEQIARNRIIFVEQALAPANCATLIVVKDLRGTIRIDTALAVMLYCHARDGASKGVSNERWITAVGHAIVDGVLELVELGHKTSVHLLPTNVGGIENARRIADPVLEIIAAPECEAAA